MLILENALIKRKSLDFLLKALKIYIALMIQTGQASTIFSALNQRTLVGTCLKAGSPLPGSNPSSLQRSVGPGIDPHASQPVDNTYFQLEQDRVQKQRGFNLHLLSWSTIPGYAELQQGPRPHQPQVSAVPQLPTTPTSSNHEYLRTYSTAQGTIRAPGTTSPTSSSPCNIHV